MILVALLLLQAAQPAPVAEKLKPIDSATAIDLFGSICWTALRDPAAVQVAIQGASIPLALQPRTGNQRADLYRADEAVLTYLASDTLPPGIPPRQCTLRVRLSGAADQLALAARIGDTLKISGARTRSTAAQSTTEWRVTGEDQRVTRLFATTRPATGGGTELRLQSLLLAGN